jgi:hypothetical protein
VPVATDDDIEGLTASSPPTPCSNSYPLHTTIKLRAALYVVTYHLGRRRSRRTRAGKREPPSAPANEAMMAQEARELVWQVGDRRAARLQPPAPSRLHARGTRPVSSRANATREHVVTTMCLRRRRETERFFRMEGLRRMHQA